MENIEKILKSGQCILCVEDLCSHCWITHRPEFSTTTHKAMMDIKVQEGSTQDDPEGNPHFYLLQPFEEQVCLQIWRQNNQLQNSITDFPQIRWLTNQKELIQIHENCVHDTNVNKVVTWTRPPELWIKINTDCSAIKNPCKIEAGGILRYQICKLLMASQVLFERVQKTMMRLRKPYLR